jgi:hypothetical protein
METPPRAWNGSAKAVNTVVVMEIIENARANEVSRERSCGSGTLSPLGLSVPVAARL